MTSGKRLILNCCIVLGIFIAVAGCSPFVENNEIEEISPVTFWYMKEGKKGKISMSTVVPPVGLEKKRLFSTEVDMIKQAGKRFNLNYYNELKNGQLRMVMIEENLADKGILPIVNTLLSDPKIGPRLYLILVKGDFDKYILSELKQSENFDFYLYQTLRHFERANQGEMSIVNLHQFKNQLYTHFSDPYVPVFRTDGNQFTYEGTGLFRNDKFVKVLAGIDDQIFQLINNNRFLKFLTVPNLSIVIGQVRSTVTFDLNQNNTALSMKVSLNAGIEEYTGDKNLQDQSEFNALVHDVESELEKKTADMIKDMQNIRVDPLEVGGEALFPFTKPMSDKAWLKRWENMDVKVDYQLNLRPIENTQ
ncbi:Ger(x)C family spore germination C-terminal domain-containing protein [Bacillus haynesii]|uniref:Ger(x)C family spore germination protein n=1 Tax=Bacillus haynesii TaxID=1925021 RepID=UPI0022814DCC|nr:Ger(x)C family spore germination C-terminal domain-containing protein [Bacillus haynesii]MCY8649794.1 spore gernimation protein [Bacillus haynesii]MCY9411178.1 spore gernimation protein [Bacillus haynesii]